ncbi:MAG TPA: hypothetical protein VMU95_19045 [Trebonia sp.]|nr:hypothetical protein [Trebonia sp.]
MEPDDLRQQPPLTSTTRRRRWPRAAVGVVLAVLGIGLAACGGGSPSAASNAASASSSSSKLEAQLLEFAACMRSHGDPSYPDPVIGSNGQPHLGGTPQQYQAPTPQFTAARAACYKYTPAGSETPAEKAAALAKAVKFAACMRSHGEPNFPDPDSGGQFEFTNGNIDTSSPQFQSAQKTCQTLDPGLQLPTSSSGS